MGLFDAWGRTHSIAIDNTKVSGTGSHTDLPVLITLDMLDAEVTDAGSNSALNGGGDIRFTSDAAGLTRLPLDVVSFVTNATPASQVCEIHVKVPSVSTSVDTTIYIWYNKAAETQPAVTDTYGRNAVWSDYLVVAHLKEAANTTAGGYVNSTGGTNGTGISMALANVTAPYGGDVAQFDGSADRVEFPISLSATDDIFTIQAWGNPDDLSTDQRLVSLLGASSSYSAEALWMDSGGTGDGWQSQSKNAALTTVTLGLDSDNDATAASWASLAHRYGSADSELYLNGASKATGSGSGNFSDGTGDADTLIIGNIWQLTGTSAYFNGGIAGVRLRMDNAVNDDWISTEYNNQNAPATFATAGTPSTPGGGATTILPFRMRY